MIDSYDHIRRTRDGEFIKVFASMDDQYKEEMRKKKRRIQDQVRPLPYNLVAKIPATSNQEEGTKRFKRYW